MSSIINNNNGTYYMDLRSIEDPFTYNKSLRSLKKAEKIDLASRFINCSRYSIVGVDGRSTRVILEPRFHNKRNRRGQFARK